MTEQIYNIDAYKKEIKSTIVEIIDDYFVIDKTIFFPGGGGQPNDFGLINADKDSFEIKRVNWQKGKIAHFLSKSDLSNFIFPICSYNFLIFSVFGFSFILENCVRTLIVSQSFIKR